MPLAPQAAAGRSVAERARRTTTHAELSTEAERRGRRGGGWGVRWWERTGARQELPRPWTIVSSLLCVISGLEEPSEGLGLQQSSRMRKAETEICGASTGAAASCLLPLTPDSRLTFLKSHDFGVERACAGLADSVLANRRLPFAVRHGRNRNPYREGFGPLRRIRILPTISDTDTTRSSTTALTLLLITRDKPSKD